MNDIYSRTPLFKALTADCKVVDFYGDEFEKSFKKTTEETKKSKKKPNKKELRSRRFSLSTYIEPSAVEKFVVSLPWVSHWAMATHDKDIKEDGTLKEMHTHILLYTYDAKTSSAILKIFDRFSQQYYMGTDIEPQNTLCQIMHDPAYMWGYLLHRDDPDKYQYENHVRIADNYIYWSSLRLTESMTDSSNNSGLQIFNDILDGTSTKTLVERYGKEYIYHARQFKEVCRDHVSEEWKKQAKENQGALNMIDYFPLLLANSTFDKQTLNAFYMVLDYIKAECLVTYNSKINLYLDEVDNEKKTT